MQCIPCFDAADRPFCIVLEPSGDLFCIILATWGRLLRSTVEDTKKKRKKGAAPEVLGTHFEELFRNFSAFLPFGVPFFPT